jgi:hypothetical protein
VDRPGGDGVGWDPVVTTAAGRRVRVATSRYGNPNVATSGLVPIGITRFPPSFKLGYELRATLYDLAPTPEMLQLATQPGGRDRFSEAYLDRLTAIGPESILTQLEAMQGEATGVAVLCYEDITDGESWCYRLLLGEWLREQAVLEVTELPDPGKLSKRRSRSTPTPQATGPTFSRTSAVARSSIPNAVGNWGTASSGDA